MALTTYLAIQAPPFEAIPGAQLARRHIDHLKALGILREGERILYLYSNGFPSIDDSVYFFTDKDVVICNQECPEPLIRKPLAGISQIEIEQSSSSWDDSKIYLNVSDVEVLSIPVSTGGGGDLKFYETLISAWRKARE